MFRERDELSLSKAAISLVCAITVGGLLLRLPSFNDSLFGDEVSTYFIATGSDLGQVLDLVRSDQEVTPPLFFVLAWATPQFGDPGESLRLVSLIAGVAAIPLTYLLGLRTVGRRAALLGATLVALSPFLIFYSTEARAYALVLVLDLLSTLFLLSALDGHRTRWWIAYAACSCGAVYAHYTAIFVLAGLLAWAFWARPQARRTLLVANLAAAVAFLPWLPEFLDDRHGPNLIGILEPFGLHSLWENLMGWSVVGGPLVRLTSLPSVLAIAIAAAGLGAGVLGLAPKARMGAVARPSAGIALVLVLALAAPAAAALYSALGTSVFDSRNLIASWPGLALSIGVLVTSASRIPGIAAALLVMFALAIGAVKMLDSQYQRPDYRAAASFINRVGAPGDPVVDAPFAPNPLSALDAALGYGQPSSEPHPVLRVGTPQRSVQVRARGRGLGPLDPLPVSRPEAIAKRAARLARGRTLFIVAIGSPALEVLRRSGFGSLGRLLKALPPDYRHIQTRTFRGFPTQIGNLGVIDFSVAVHVLREDPRREQVATRLRGTASRRHRLVQDCRNTRGGDARESGRCW